MPLASGSRLGPYEIVDVLGAGGMGEVYRAHDTRLKREVALKLLPDIFASDPDRLARFEREAQVLAALNHPRIAQVYGLEESSGVRAIAMELVEGETLEEKLRAAGDASAAGTVHARGLPAIARHTQAGRAEREGCPSTRSSRSRGNWPMRSKPRTSAASSTAT